MSAPVIALRAGSATDVGLVRSNNQDNLLMSTPLFAVADGMGGHAGGEVASATAVSALGAAFAAEARPDPEALVIAARQANRTVWERAQSDPDLRGMGTTLAAVALVEAAGDGELAVINVGDSRVYMLRSGELEQLTVDHSLIAELVATGQVPAEEAEFHPQRHVLTRALGVDADVAVDLLTVTPFRGDRLLLCSDGLIREVSDPEVASILRRLSDPDDAARELVAEARLRGGSDNITVVVVDVVEDGERAARASEELAGDATEATPVPGPRQAGEEQAESAEPTVAVAAAPMTDPGVKGVTVDTMDRDWGARLRAGGTGERGTADRTMSLPTVAPADTGASRRARRRATRAATSGYRPRARFVTGRVVAFVVTLLVILALAAAAVGYYARGTYFVGVDGNQVIVFKGRPGGVLWFAPTVADHTGVTTAQIEGRHIPELRAGVTESSMSASLTFVDNLTREYAQAQRALGSTTPSAAAPAAAGPG